MAQIAEQEQRTIQNSKKQESLNNKVKRYNLVLPTNLYDEVQTLANKENISVLELLKRFIKIGLVVTKLCQSTDTRLVIREGDRERELILL